jgi:hypothetical protein
MPWFETRGETLIAAGQQGERRHPTKINRAATMINEIEATQTPKRLYP